MPCDVRLDIQDFSVPTRDNLTRAIEEAITILEKDGVIYVGCMGGIGRTGMFMGCLVKMIAVREKVLINSGWRGFVNSVKSLLSIRAEYYGNQTIISYPVEYVRAHYLNYAIETTDQEVIVRNF